MTLAAEATQPCVWGRIALTAHKDRLERTIVWMKKQKESASSVALPVENVVMNYKEAIEWMEVLLRTIEVNAQVTESLFTAMRSASLKVDNIVQNHTKPSSN